MNDNFNPLPKLEFDKKRKHAKTCPCGKDNKDGKFCPYKGYDDKGYCFSCGKTFLPDLPAAGKPVNKVKWQPPKKMPPPSFIPIPVFMKTLNFYEQNTLVFFLNLLVGESVTKQIIARYFIGTSRFWPNATIFWQIAKGGDPTKRIRSGKIMQYNIIDSANSFIGKDCKRNKNNLPPIKWVHRLFKTDTYNLSQCLFGEHLLTDDLSKPVAIVESEKTALIASAYLPGFTWLAAGALTNLTRLKCEVLKGRRVVLFPDLNGFELWTTKAEELSTIAQVTVSDLLERKGTEADRKSGLDLADYLIRFDYKTFNQI